MNHVSPGKLTIVIGGAFVFLFSFLSWYSYGGTSASGWSSDTLPGLFPLGFFVGIFGLAAALGVGLAAFTQVKLPEKVLDFTVDQLVLVLGAFNVVVTISLIIGATHGSSAGFGLIVCFLGSAAIVVGWFLDRQGVGAKPAEAAGDAPQPGVAPPQGYAPPPQQPPVQQAPPAGYPPQQPPPAQQPVAPQGPPPGYPPQQQQQPQAPDTGYAPPGYQPPPEPPTTGSF
jgi:hypothetical protein